MNKKTKSVLQGVLIAVLIVVLVLSFQALMLFVGFRACQKALSPYEEYFDGYFKYIIVGEDAGKPKKNDKKYVAIIDFTAWGAEQEIIDVPREINGKPVRYIGYHRQNSLMGGNYQLYNKKLKKLYIHENIQDVYSQALSAMMPGLEIMVCAAKNPNLIFSEGSTSGAIRYVYKSVNESDNVGFVANIEFLNNYSTEINDGYYSLDNIQEGETIPQPANPEREGYEFTGWYTETACENLWDFAESPEIREGDEFKLYAGWRKK